MNFGSVESSFTPFFTFETTSHAGQEWARGFFDTSDFLISLQVIEDVYKKLKESGFDARQAKRKKRFFLFRAQVTTLEFNSFLERQLWPSFDTKATPAHLITIALLINEKVRSLNSLHKEERDDVHLKCILKAVCRCVMVVLRRGIPSPYARRSRFDSDDEMSSFPRFSGYFECMLELWHSKKLSLREKSLDKA